MQRASPVSWTVAADRARSGRLLTAQRWLALAMLCLQAATLARLSGTVAFPATVALLALLVMWSGVRLVWSRDQLFVVLVALVAVFTVKYLVFPTNPQYRLGFLQFQLAFVVSQFVLTWQLVHFCVLDAAALGPARHAIQGQWISLPEVLLHAQSSGEAKAAAGADSASSRDAPGVRIGAAGVGAERLIECLLRADRLPALFPLYGAVTLGSMAIVRLDPRDRWTVAVPAALFACLVGLFASASVRRLRSAGEGIDLAEPERDDLSVVFGPSPGVRVVVAALLLLVALGGWAAAAAMRRFEREIDHLLVNLFRDQGGGGALGFSGQSALGSVHRRKLRSENRVMLRVYGSQPPGYMRGQVFVEYRDAMWHTVPSTRSLDPSEVRPLMFPRVEAESRLFALEDGVRAERWSVFECWPDPSLATYLFTPLGTTHVAAAVNEVSVTPRHNIVRSDELLPGHPYTAFVPRGRWSAGEAPSPQFLQNLTEVPAYLERRLKPLAEQVLAGCQTPAEKIRAVRAFLRNNFEYRLGIEIYGDEDPVVYFLKNRLPAHCEYFATAGTLLLRLGGVPARYVTGFVVDEPNEYAGCWLARNRDAHAWVEAFDPTRGWVIVECTPAAGVPQGEPSSAFTQAWDGARQWWRRLRVRWDREGMHVVGEVLIALLVNGPVQLLIALVIGFAGWQRWRVWRLNRNRATPVDPHLTAMHALLQRADRHAERRQQRRRTNETLHEFAARLTLPELAQWYREYAACRYQPQTISQAAVRRLRQSLERICRS